jgi:hypothetical protein
MHGFIVSEISSDRGAAAGSFGRRSRPSPASVSVRKIRSVKYRRSSGKPAGTPVGSNCLVMGE